MKILNKLKHALTNSRRARKQVDNYNFILPLNMLFTVKGERYYEENVTHWLREIINIENDPVFYDIGANFGYYSIIFSNAVKKIYAFEPIRKSFQFLEENIENNMCNNIQAVNTALGEKENWREMHTYNSSGNNSFYIVNVPRKHSLKRIGKERVQVSSIDKFTQKNIPPSIIKIDVEGAEWLVVKGGRETIAKHHPYIIFENNSGSKEKIKNYLGDIGYTLFGLSNNYTDNTLFEGEMSREKIANILAVPKNRIGKIK